MLRDNNLMNKYPEVVAAMKEVVEKGGFGTSVTPVSQFYFQQAFNNVMFGKWKKIAEGYGKMVLGYFGKTPCEPDSEVVKIAHEQLGLEPTTETVVDLNDKDPNKGLEVAKKRLEDAGLEVNDENLFISAACKEKGILFLQGKGTIGVRKNEAKSEEASTVSGGDTNGYTVTVNGKKYAVALEGNKATVNGKLYDIAVKEGIEAKAASDGEGTPVKAALPGNVLKVLVSEGDTIAEGDVIAVVEAMKMETEIKSPVGGTVKSVEIEVGNKVQTGQVLVTVG
jgi:pyruvate carboxylase subunit B